MSTRLHLTAHLERFGLAVVACAGDVMLDRFVYGEVRRISPEAPIPVLEIQSQRSMLGGLGNAVRNLGALGCASRVYSITGEDAAGREVAALLGEVPGCQSVLQTEASRRTPVKTRYIAHSQQLLRTDHETMAEASAEVFAALRAQFERQLSEASIVFLSDYDKGVLKGEHASMLIRASRAAGKPVVVDPKGRDFTRYRGATVIKPNLRELAEASGLPTADTASQEIAARSLLEQTGADYLLVTRGAAGMLLVPRMGERKEFPALVHEVYDVSGAGDTVAAVLAAALGSGAAMVEAVELANIAAGIVVAKAGTAVASRAEILMRIET